MKKYLNRDVFLILLGNILASFSFYAVLFTSFFFLLLINNNIQGFISLFLFLFLFSSRLILLPILYTYLEKNTKHDIVKTFICKLKISFVAKFLILTLAFIFAFIDVFYYCGKIYIKLLCISLFFGLFGSYLILFLYWFIVDIIKHIKEQR